MNTKTFLHGLILGGFLAGNALAEKGADTARGTLVFGEDGTELNSMAHWDEYAWGYEAIRWGRYSVEVSYYGLKRAMGVQARFRSNKGDLAKGFLQPGGTKEEPKKVRLGESVYVAEHGKQEVILLTPQDDPMYDFKLTEVRLVPAPEGEEVVQEDSGAVVLLAKDATTFAEKMRYEPKEEKNCLGFWIFADDWAEWEFEVTKGGVFAATVHQGCGAGNGGSTVAVASGEQKLTFKVEDTGGFQNWKAIPLGKLTFEPGVHRLSIRPVDQAGKAVMDVQKIVLEPVE